MSYPNAHILLRAGGTFGASATGVETWSVGFRFGVKGADVHYSESMLLAFVTACLTALQTFHSGSAASVGGSCYLTNATAARIGLDGKYDPEEQYTQRVDTAGTAGGNTTDSPWTSCSVISLRTARPRGVASNGRIYYPMTSLNITATTGRINSTATGQRLAAARTLINALNTQAAVYATNMTLMVMSQVGAGLAERVTAIRADDRVDNIERRENAVVPVYTSLPIP